MPGFLQEHRGPLAGAAGLHLVLLALFAGAALRWTSSQPPVELAIEGYLVEGPLKVRPLREPREPAVVAPPPAAELPPPAPQLPAERREEPPAPDAAAVERAAELESERRAAEQRAVAEAQAKLEAEQAEQAEARRRAQEAEALRVAQQAEAAGRRAEAEAARKAAEEETRRKAEAAEVAKRRAEAEAARKAAEEETRRKTQAAEAARQQAEREAALQRRLAAEEEAASFARSGVIDEYRSLLVQTIERNWIRPPSARAGLQCTLYVTQAPGGSVVDVRLGACNGDQPVRESIVTAVYKSDPLPAPRDPRAFERRLEIVFKPTE